MKKSFKIKIMKWNQKMKNMMKMEMNEMNKKELAEMISEPHQHQVPNVINVN